MKYLLLLLVFIGFQCCIYPGEESRIPQLTYTDSAYIKISAENITDTIEVLTNFCSLFPTRNCSRQKVIVTKPGEYFIAYKMTKPELIHVTIEKEFTVMLIPADTLEIKVGFEQGGTKAKSAYHRINDDINNYYQAKFIKFGYYTFLDENKPGWEYWIKSIISKTEYDRAISLLVAAEKENFNFLEDNKKILPKWFVKLEKANITYGSALTKIQFFKKANNDKYSENISLKIDFNNPDAVLSSVYYYFISEYMLFRYPLENNNLIGAARGISYFTKQEPAIDSILSGSVRNYYVSFALSDLYSFFSQSAEDFKMVDGFIKDRNFKLKDEDYNFIIQEKKYTQIKLNIKDNLEAGDKASGFYLKDERDIVHKLSDYEGKTVYLHFWATWCQPCIKEIPEINSLYSKLVNKPIEIINICLDDNAVKWREIIERENLKGINLVCKGNWESSLRSKYFINELPHFTLVDKKGLIIKNYCSGASDIYDELMKSIENK